jgi:hypothetical protein
MSWGMQSAALVLTGLLFGAGPASGAPRLVFQSALTKVFQDEPPPPGKPTWQLCMARGERESVQLLITAGAAGLQGVTVVDAGGGKDGLAIELSLVAYIKTVAEDRRPWAKTEGIGKVGWWPDPLLPNRPFDVAAGQTQPVWITVFAPPGVTPGEYPAKLRIRLGAGETREMAYRVRVLDVDLPASQALRNAAFMPPGNLSAHYQPKGGIEGAEFLALYKRWLRKAFSQHLGPTFDMLMGWNQESIRTNTTAGPLGPTAEMLLGRSDTHLVWPLGGAKGNYDFRAVDEILSVGREFGLRQFAIAMFAKKDGRERPGEESNPGLADLLRAYSAHLRAKGLFDAAYVYNSDEPPEKLWNTVRDNYRFVKSVIPDMKVWLCLNEPKAVSALKGYTDIWDVYIRQFERSGVETRRKEGEQVVWGVCVWPHEHPNLFIEYPAVDARMIGWLTYRYGLSGFEYWGLNQWGENTGRLDWANFERGGTRTTWQRTKWPWGDGWLMYPGNKGEPLSSVRFENLRDGLEDAELLLLLQSQGGKSEADRIAASVARSITDYESDPEVIARAHVALLEALSAHKKNSKVK